MFKVPELLAPGGSFDKLEVALRYGADAVYIGGQKFGLRTASDNFTELEILRATELARKFDSKIFVVINSFFHDQDFNELPKFLELLSLAKVDALIVSDIGVIKVIRELCDIPVHLSTQASCLNVDAAKFWKKQGVERVVLGREVSLEEASFIKKQAQVEVELFIHGAMCMAYSGNCVISNYTQGRDSNRGGCAHSCRFEYDIYQNDNNHQNAFFMSSKDLNGISLLEKFITLGIDSLKVEGRMKSEHYVGTVTKIYREALDTYKQNGKLEVDELNYWENELRKISHRDYTQASLEVPAGAHSIFDEREHVESETKVAGVVLEAIKDQHLLIQVRSPFFGNSELSLLPFKGKEQSFSFDKLQTIDGSVVEKTKPGMLIKAPYVDGAARYNLVRSIR